MLVADLNGPVVEMLKKANALDPAGTKALIPGRIHPSSGGHLIMAEALLKAWGASPVVTEGEIDAAARRVARSENTSVSSLAAGTALTWSQKDEALPMPVSLRDRSLPINQRRGAATMELALQASDFMQVPNRQTLRVSGLESARYTLKINSSPVGSFSREQLAEGGNLAELPTPMARQALRVYLLNYHRGEVTSCAGSSFRWGCSPTI